jgi:hypothetical protein
MRRIGQKIEHCRRLASSASDQKIFDQIEALVEQLLAEKACRSILRTSKRRSLTTLKRYRAFVNLFFG